MTDHRCPLGQTECDVCKALAYVDEQQAFVDMVMDLDLRSPARRSRDRFRLVLVLYVGILLPAIGVRLVTSQTGLLLGIGVFLLVMAVIYGVIISTILRPLLRDLWSGTLDSYSHHSRR